jgi:hypothetical protein
MVIAAPTAMGQSPGAQSEMNFRDVMAERSGNDHARKGNGLANLAT